MLNEYAKPSRGRREDIYAALKHGILTGALPPGHQLRLRDIAAEHGASMMPVREAIVALETVGLVTQIPYRGAFVSRLTLEKLRDFYNARLVVEPGALEIGTPVLNDEHFESLHGLLGEIDTKASKDNWHLVIDLDERFLMTIYQAAGSAALTEMIQTLWNRVTPYKYHLIEIEPSAAYKIVEHNKELVSLLEKRDVLAAKALLQASLRQAMTKLCEALPV